MKLLFDVGNTRIKWACVSNQEMTRRGSVIHRESDWDLDALLDLAQPPVAAYAVSVAGTEINDRLAELVMQRWGLALRFQSSPQSGCGVVNRYIEPHRLGADRWAAVVAAFRRAGAACVIDCGSAVTFDTVTVQGEYQGGLILPGLGLMRRSLTSGTHLLPAVEAGDTQLFARDTVTAIHSGTLIGLAALVDGLAERVQRSVGGPLTFFLTGGDADQLAPHLRLAYVREPDLVLHGVALIAEDNA